MKNRLRFITPKLLRNMDITPADVKPVGEDTALSLARIKLSFAAMLKRDLNKSRHKDFIGGFNCSRPDGSPIVAGCSNKVWTEQRNRALNEALAYLEMAENEPARHPN